MHLKTVFWQGARSLYPITKGSLKNTGSVRWERAGSRKSGILGLRCWLSNNNKNENNNNYKNKSKHLYSACHVPGIVPNVLHVLNPFHLSNDSVWSVPLRSSALQKRHLRLRGVKSHAQGHSAGKRERWALKPGENALLSPPLPRTAVAKIGIRVL